MRWLTPTTATLIVAVLAVLLVGYVFGGANSRSDGQAADPSTRNLAADCSSRQTSELLKRELFGRATALRGRDQAAMAEAARYSVVRVASASATKIDEGDGAVTCAGSLIVDLPPQMAVVGGRRSLTGQAEYEVRGGSEGRPQLRLLSNPTAIVTPLAALTGVQADAPETFDVQSPDANASAPADVTAADAQPGGALAQLPPPPRRETPLSPPPPARGTVAGPARTEAARRPLAREPERQVAAARPRPPQPSPSPSAERSPQPAADPPAAAAQPARQAAVARPSFDCRRARSRSEIAVCGDASLAALDRQMSGRFFAALRAARPGQRALLQRSRNRFLAYRNTCGTSTCIAQAYRDRMREIDTIMTGGF